jgi:hypothetical protein
MRSGLAGAVHGLDALGDDDNEGGSDEHASAEQTHEAELALGERKGEREDAGQEGTVADIISHVSLISDDHEDSRNGHDGAQREQHKQSFPHSDGIVLSNWRSADESDVLIQVKKRKRSAAKQPCLVNAEC